MDNRLLRVPLFDRAVCVAIIVIKKQRVPFHFDTKVDKTVLEINDLFLRQCGSLGLDLKRPK